MKVNFVKMNSQGNDFIIIDNTIAAHSLTLTQIKKISSRDDIGCDQLLMLDIKDMHHVSCRIFNQDGSEAYQCGNGMRAIMFFLNKYYKYIHACIIVKGIKYLASIDGEKNIKINMGKPDFINSKIVSDLPVISIDKLKVGYMFRQEDFSFSYSPISLGNFHCVVFSDDCYSEKERISKILYNYYKDEPNISFILNYKNFYQKKDSHIRLKVKERGAGWTKSCGSGASATAALVIKNSIHSDDLIDRVSIEQDGGRLDIQWMTNSDSDNNLYLIGPTTFEYEGIWND